MSCRVFGMCVALIGAAALVSGQPQPSPNRPDEPGIVEGRATYKADPERSWRYARYYVKDRSKGYLAEAVVALNGKGLKTAARAATANASLARMDQKEFRFVPETLAIRAGDSVRFTNSDSQLHNVRTSEESLSFNVNTPVGGDYTHCFDVAGGIKHPFRMGCVFHSQMQAWIFVFGHPFFCITGEDGRFRFEGVPPGEYDLEIAHAAGNLRFSQRVIIRAGETTSIDLPVSPDNLVE
jgi:plastocyanin